MDNQTPSPQDPTRFSKPISEPPILDLEAKKPETKSDQAAPSPRAEAPRHDKIGLRQPAKTRFPIQGILGGIISGSIIAVAWIGYTAWQNRSGSSYAKLEAALSAKPDQSQLDAITQRIDSLEAGLTELKSGFASILKQSSAPDADFVKRIESLEANIAAIVGREATTPSASRNPTRLVVAFTVRDLVTSDRSFTKELNMLEALGETSGPFASLRQISTTPLASYASLIAMIEKSKAAKSVNVAPDADAPSEEQNSQITNLIGRLVTIRPADKPEEKSSANTNMKPITEALQNRRASDALNLLRALPEVDRATMKPVETELARRAAAERASNALVDDLLDRITKEGKP